MVVIAKADGVSDEGGGDGGGGPCGGGLSGCCGGGWMLRQGADNDDCGHFWWNCY